MNSDIGSIYDFWFGDNPTDLDAKKRNKLWFMGGVKIDSQIRAQFEPLIVRAGSRQLDHWRQWPQGSTALIILLDQFPLNIYRGDSRAYACEQYGVDVCLRGIADGQDRELSFFERAFFYLPLEHSESREHQRLSIKYFTALRDEAPERYADEAGTTLKYALDHKAVVDRFGRYPHRNKVLGRESTADEIAYLKQGGATYGQ